MNTAPLDPSARRVVRALYELAELDCPASAGLLARAVGIRPADMARVLLRLEARGLVNQGGASLAPPRARIDARLTLLGLAYAVRQPDLGLLRAHERGRTKTARETPLVAVRRHASLAAAHPRAASRAGARSGHLAEGALRHRTLAG